MPSYPSILSTNQSKPINFGAINTAPGAVKPQSVAPNAALATKTATPAVVAPQPTYSPSGGAIIPSTAASTAIGGIDTSAPVNVSTLAGSSPLNLPSLPEAPVPNYATMDFSSYFQNSREQDRLQSEKTDLTKDITDTQDKLGTKSARAAELETAANIPGLSEQLNEIDAQIRQVQSESLQAFNQSEDRRAPTFAIRGEQASIERMRAAKVYGLAAASSALQGRLSLANANVQRALDAEFGGLQQDIENKKFLLELNRDSFDAEEQRVADARSIALDQAKEQLAVQRADRESALKVMLQAAANGAPTAILDRISAASSPEDALAIAAPYIQDPAAKYELESARLDNILKAKQISLLGQPSVTEQKEADAAAQAKTVAFENASSTLAIAQQLRDMIANGQGNSVIGGSRVFNAGVALPGSKAATVYSLFDQLKDTLAFGNIDKLKGAMSDKDIAFLRNIGTNLRPELSETAFLNELDSIILRMGSKLEANLFDDDEKAALDGMFRANSGTSIIDPSSFF